MRVGKVFGLIDEAAGLVDDPERRHCEVSLYEADVTVKRRELRFERDARASG